MTAANQAPVKPISINPEETYIQISYTTSEPPKLAYQGVELEYKGPVGELKGEGIFQVLHQDNASPVKRSEELWLNKKDGLVKELKGLNGVTGVNAMGELKMRSKREEF
ncbi:uncharacterized protein IL334_007174 [Kwoniella shivajii]|uniref:Uncharacterized protein n=1 Tax=Kwoniella shivajii TaxID=564305 RepID=A0ABZ1D7X8_9TREE|nr:hypothetical protein IL334_007174 [Kwoniella shivajii]